jgi:hypothetical protein
VEALLHWKFETRIYIENLWMVFFPIFLVIPLWSKVVGNCLFVGRNACELWKHCCIGNLKKKLNLNWNLWMFFFPMFLVTDIDIDLKSRYFKCLWLMLIFIFVCVPQHLIWPPFFNVQRHSLFSSVWLFLFSINLQVKPKVHLMIDLMVLILLN